MSIDERLRWAEWDLKAAARFSEESRHWLAVELSLTALVAPVVALHAASQQYIVAAGFSVSLAILLHSLHRSIRRMRVARAGFEAAAKTHREAAHAMIDARYTSQAEVA
jgi:hypothetical protein